MLGASSNFSTPECGPIFVQTTRGPPAWLQRGNAPPPHVRPDMVLAEKLRPVRDFKRHSGAWCQLVVQNFSSSFGPEAIEVLKEVTETLNLRRHSPRLQRTLVTLTPQNVATTLDRLRLRLCTSEGSFVSEVAPILCCGEVTAAGAKATL